MRRNSFTVLIINASIWLALLPCVAAVYGNVEIILGVFKKVSAVYTNSASSPVC